MKYKAYKGMVYDIERDCIVTSGIASSKRAFTSMHKEYNNSGYHFIFKPYEIDVDEITSDIANVTDRECVKMALTAYFKPISKDNK